MLKNILFSLFGLLISLILLELVVRFILLPGSKKPSWSDRPEYYYRKSVSSKEDQGHSIIKPKNTFRIAVVGDSISYGPFMQFDDVYAKRLERMYNLNKSDKSLEVINYAISGYSTFHEIELVKKAIREDADLLILQITLNDPELAPLDVQHERTVQRFGPFRPGTGLKKIISYWKTLGFVLMRLHNSRTHYEYKKYFFELFENKDSWEGFYNSLKIIYNLANQNNLPMMAVVFPLLGEDLDDNYPFTKIHNKIAKALDEIGIQNLDLSKNFMNIPVSRLHVIPGVDFHPNEIGHRIAAEKIYRWLKKKNLVPEEFQIQNFAQR